MSLQTVFLNISIILIIIYLMTCAGYFLLHRYFIIFPSRKLTLTPLDYQLPYEETFFSTEDNVLLQGWFIKGKGAEESEDFTVVLFPGNKGTMSDFLSQVRALSEAGFNVFMFSYRGFGKSQKKWPTEKGVYKDSKAACEYLVKYKNISNKKIIFLGQSLGAAMASSAALLFDPYLLILEGGFPSIVQVVSRAVKWLPLSLITRTRFETGSFLKKVKCPVLIVHSEEDGVIPVSDAHDLFKEVSGHRKLAFISGPHAKGLEQDRKKYLNEIGMFIKEISH